jgi:hypothetical protein
VFVALGIQHAMPMRRILCDQSGSLIFFHIISLRHDFQGGREGAGRVEITEHNVCFDFLYNFCLKYFPFLEEFGVIL